MRLPTKLASAAVLAAMVPSLFLVASVVAAPAAGAATSCHATVKDNATPVRKTPSGTARVLETKNRGAAVAGPCYQYITSTITWDKVDLARGGYGWINNARLSGYCKPGEACSGTTVIG